MVAIVGIVSLVLTLAVVAIATFVISRSRREVPGGNAPVYRARKVYTTVLMAVLSVGLAISLTKTPYTAYASDAPATQVDVIGRMWSWEMKVGGKTALPLVLPQGKLVEFAVTAGDVNHGFGIYDAEGHLLGQTQAMPGYVNRLRMIFDEPGEYHVLCLEYCGLVHHAMLTKFEVR